MKLNNIRAILLCSSLALSSNVLYAADNVVATFDGGSVTTSQANKVLHQIFGDKLPEGKKDFTEVPYKIQEDIINNLILNDLLSAEVTQSKIADDPEVQKNLEELKRRVLIQDYLNNIINKQFKDSDVKKRYDKLAKDMGKKKEIHAYHILVKNESEAQDIYNKLKDGADFTKLAQEYSLDKSNKEQGGDLGYFAEGSMVKPFEDAAFALKKDEVSKPVKTDFGWHVIKVTDIRKATPPKFDDVKPQITEEVRREIVDKYLSGLLEKAHVKILVENKDSKKE